MWQPPPNWSQHEPQRADEHEAGEDLHVEHAPTDGAELGSLSERDGHDDPKLLSCETRRADEYLQVSRKRSQQMRELSQPHVWSPNRRFSQSEVDSPS